MWSGETHADASGLGEIWIRCSVAAANKVADARRLLLRGVAARVKLLQIRALQCYHCLVVAFFKLTNQITVHRQSRPQRFVLSLRSVQPYGGPVQCQRQTAAGCIAAGRPSGYRVDGKACGPFTQPPKRSFAKAASLAWIAVESAMKYLRLVVDSRWNFGPYIHSLAFLNASTIQENFR